MYCMNCVFWQRDGADGICRKEHPKPLIGLVATYTIIWPRTRGDEWCGSFKENVIKELDEAKRNYT
jgi:hypothetical protein